MIIKMGREIIKEIYLLIYKVTFSIFNLLPSRNKVTFVISFGDNSRYVYDQIRRNKVSCEAVVLYQGSSNSYFKNVDNIDLIPLNSFNIYFYIKGIYHLATSKYVLIDNYFGFLAALDFKKGVECIQLWHASGAIKKFGLEDQSVVSRSKRAKARFSKVYKNFHKVVVGSDVMADYFIKAFGLSSKNILFTGIPRTDFFFDKDSKKSIKERFNERHPELLQKKKVLYAPTYRDGQLNHFELKLDLNLMEKELGDDYVLLLRLHPAIKDTSNYAVQHPGFVYDFSSAKFDINELLLIADYLITDYSSIPYEFSLLGKPMVFFAYDLDTYEMERGLWDRYEKMVPGPIVKSSEEIITVIKESSFDLKVVKDYSRKWNKYSNGQSSENLVNYMLFNNKKTGRE